MEDNSSAANIRIPVEEFADADALEADFTRENMTEIELGNEIFHEVNPVGIAVIKENGEFLCVIRCQESLQDYVQNQIDNYTERLIEEGVI